MKNELVTFETAKLADKAGFDWEVYAAYNKNNEELEDLSDIYHYACEGGMELDEWFGNYNSKSWKSLISAPTQSLLQRWLREVHNIHVEVICNNIVTKLYTCEITAMHFEKITKTFKSFEEALEEGLKQSLKRILNEKK